jgi:N-acetylneuraminic acid mutarotase
MIIFDLKNKNNLSIYNNNFPQLRYSHSSLLHNNKLFIFGGKDYLNRTLLNDFFIFDFELQEVQTYFFQNSPCERKNHTSFEYNGDIYIYGGVDRKETVLGDIWRLDFEKKEWFEISEPKLPARCLNSCIVSGK